MTTTFRKEIADALHYQIEASERGRSNKVNRWFMYEEAKAALRRICDSDEEYDRAIKSYIEQTGI